MVERTGGGNVAKAFRRATATPSTPPTLSSSEGGGFNRLDKVFEGRLPQVLEAFNGTI